MAISHIINCLLVVYAPLLIAYKAKNLQDYRAIRVCLIAALACLITAFCKIFLMASFSAALPEQGNIITDFIQNSFNLLDCYGMYVLLNYKMSQVDDPQARVLAVAIGWSAMENTLLHFFHIVPSASSDEFTWSYILRALYSNMDFFETILTVGLVMTIVKKQKRDSYSVLQDVGVLALIVFRSAVVPTILSLKEYTFDLVGFKAGLTALFVLAGRNFVKV